MGGSALALALVAPTALFADEGGVSFWLPGLFGSLAAVPQPTPGWSFVTFSYYTNVSAGADVAAAREIQIGRFTPTADGQPVREHSRPVGLQWVQPNYAFATPVLGGQLTLGMGAFLGRSSTDLTGTLTTTLGPLVSVRGENISSAVTGFGDLYPVAMLKWHDGVHNYMVYATGDIPVGAYDPSRLANLGIGHGAIDGGAGYTYLRPEDGSRILGGTGLTYNFKNVDTGYQNGIDWHLDWGASKYLSKQLFVGAVGYFYQQLTADMGQAPILGEFKSRVIGIGPQLGYLFPVADMQGYSI